MIKALTKWTILAVILTGGAAAALAPTAVSESYDLPFWNTNLSAVHGKVGMTCPGSPCTFGFSAPMLPGYAVADVWVTDTGFQFNDDHDHDLQRVKVLVEPDPASGGYDPTTGQFRWMLTAAFDANPIPPNPEFEVTVSVNLMAVDGVGAILNRRLLTPFGPNCTTAIIGTACTNNQALVGVGSGSTEFQQVLISGFDLSVNQGIGIAVSTIAVETSYTRNLSDAVGSTEIAFRGDTGGAAALVSAQVELVTLALDNRQPWVGSFNYSKAGATGFTATSGTTLDDQVSMFTVDSVGTYIGLQSFALTALSPAASPLQQLQAGCSDLTYAPVGGGPNGQASYVWHFSLRSQVPSPVIKYDGTEYCAVGFLQK